MRVLMILPHPIEGPSSRFRAYQFLPFLEASGVTAVVRPFLSSQLMPQLYASATIARKLAFTAYGTAQRLADIARATRCDVVYVLREAFPFGPPVLESLMSAAAGRLVFDFDDAIYMRSLAYDNPLDRLRDWNKPAKILGRAHKIIAGSPHLAEYARQFSAAENVHVLPTVVDPAAYCPVARPPDRRGVTVGWIGTPRGSAYLRDLMPAFRSIAASRSDVRFVFVGAEPFHAEGLPVTFRSWSLNREIADLQSFDIGIMPLTDDEESRGKCGFKLIQYMSAEVAPVCSPIGVNTDIVQHGVTGLFASKLDDWVDAIILLAEQADVRQRFGAAGRQQVIERFSLSFAAPRFLNILLEASAR